MFDKIKEFFVLILDRILIEFVLIFKNPSSKLPYHNNTHARNVYKLAKEIVRREKFKLSLAHKRILMYSCLLHDVDHSGGALTDDYNIYYATTTLKKLTSISEYTDAIEYNIKATMFPYKSKESTYLGKVIRDADRLEAIYYKRIDAILNGLRAEMSFYGEVSTDEMIRRQEQFIYDFEAETKTGNDLIIDRGEEFIMLLKLKNGYNESKL